MTNALAPGPAGRTASVASAAGPAGGVASRSATRDGVVEMLPISIGYVPFALVVGAAVSEHGAGVAGWAGSWVIYGGSAHLTAVKMLDTSGAIVAVVSALLINARLLAYSASLGQRWRHQPRWFRASAAAMLIDPTWAVAERAARRDARDQRAFFLAAGVTLGLVWSAAIAAGAVAGVRLESGALEVAAPLSLVALVGPRLTRRDERWPLLVAAAVALASVGAPAGLGTVVAVVAAVAAGELLAAGRR